MHNKITIWLVSCFSVLKCLNILTYRFWECLQMILSSQHRGGDCSLVRIHLHITSDLFLYVYILFLWIFCMLYSVNYRITKC